MITIMMVCDYYSYQCGHVYEMPVIDSEAILMAGVAIEL